jgi:predicted ArsR family transcriptional regulator
MTLEIGNAADKRMISNVQKEMLIDYLTDHVTGDAASLAAVLGVKPSRARRLLQQLAEEGLMDNEKRIKDMFNPSDATNEDRIPDVKEVAQIG